MTKLSPKIRNRINILKSFGKVKGKDYFLNGSGDLVIIKRDYNEIVKQ